MVCEGNVVSPVDAQRTVACKYARAGQIVARTANGIRQTYEYDKNGKKGGPFYISFTVYAVAVKAKADSRGEQKRNGFLARVK